MRFQTIASEPVFEGRVFRVRQDRVRLPDGREALLDVVEHAGAVTMVPIDSEGRIHFVRQLRYPVGTQLLELPAGTLEPDEPLEATARRECEEEIGQRPERLVPLGSFFHAPGYSTERNHLFLALDLTPSTRPGDDDEWIDVVTYSFAEAGALIRDGEIQDAKTLAGLFLAARFLGKLHVLAETER